MQSQKLFLAKVSYENVSFLVSKNDGRANQRMDKFYGYEEFCNAYPTYILLKG